MNRTKLQLMLGSFLIIVGALLIISIIRNQETSLVTPGPLSVNALSASSASSLGVHGVPSELQIPSMNIDLQVIPGIYNPNTKTWTLSLDKAQYAVITPEPNNVAGNTFIYGHYRSEVFATLHTIKPNAVAIVKTTNNHAFYYQLTSVRVTDPNDSSLFSYKGKPILTLQTCTGLFFQNRQLFTFQLVKVT